MFLNTLSILVSFLSFIGATQAYLLIKSITHNKYLFPLLYLFSDCISAKSAPENLLTFIYLFIIYLFIYLFFDAHKNKDQFHNLNTIFFKDFFIHKQLSYFWLTSNSGNAGISESGIIIFCLNQSIALTPLFLPLQHLITVVMTSFLA